MNVGSRAVCAPTDTFLVLFTFSTGSYMCGTVLFVRNVKVGRIKRKVLPFSKLGNVLFFAYSTKKKKKKEKEKKNRQGVTYGQILI